MTEALRILLLDDSDADAALVTRALQRAPLPIAVTWVASEIALRAALASGPWDAVISDWAMPGYSALAALAAVRAVLPDIPFLIVSGTIGEEQAVAGMRAGANDYVLKDNLARLVPAIEREIREAALRRAHRRTEARFRALVEKSAEAVLLTSADGTIAYASPASTPIFGAAAEALHGRRLSDLVHPDDRPFAETTLARLRADGALAVPVEWRVVRSDGGVRWLAVTGTNLLADPAVGAIVANLRDVTEQRRSADALRASEARFARLAESGIIGILTIDIHGAILAANNAWLALVGYSRDELAAGAIRWTDLVAPGATDALAAKVAEIVQRGFAPPWETVAVRRDGTRVPILIGAAILDYPVCIAFSIDLTEKSRAEAALRATEEQLRQAQKMEAVGRLAGGVAHDFNNVLSIILSYAEMLLEDFPPDDPRREEIHEICRAGWRAADLTRQLLMFSRQQMLEPRVLDLNALLANMDKMLRRVLGEDVELVTVRAEGLGSVRADPSSIEQVIMNLVVNARDAMPVGGTLVLETANVVLADEDPPVGAELVPGPYVRLSVRDTGVGMDAVTQARIFEPFFTTKPKDKGTGLGLSTVFGIARQSGGSVRVRSTPGAGTTFEVYLPCVTGMVEPLRERAALPARGSETILLVEDEDQVRAVAREILRRAGYTVVEVPDAAAAVAHAANPASAIDLLLTDVVMPQMSGPELAKRLASTRPALGVICMSGYTDESIVRHGAASSDLAFLQKPITRDALLRKVREVLDARHGAAL